MPSTTATRLVPAALLAGLALYLLSLLGHLGLGGLLDDWLYMIVEGAAAVVVCARAATVARDRLGWSLLAVYLTLWWIGDLGWTVHFDNLDEPPFPNWTDAVYVLSYGFAYAGLLVLLRTGVRRVQAAMWLDGLVGGLALGALCTAVFFGPIAATSGRGIEAATTLAYPVLDAVLLCLVGLGFGITGWRPDRVWAALGLGLAIAAVGDAAYSYQEAVGTYGAEGWVNATWPAAMVAVAIAAVQPRTRGVARAESADIIAIPMVFSGLALGLLMWSQTHRLPLLAAGLAGGALAAAGARALLTHYEHVALLRVSRREAMTDGLTGLGNRRRLMDDLDVAVAAAHQGLAVTLVFFDLDGFKAYNDTFGHGAGDALLRRLAESLDAAVAGHGVAYRLGGDEFCVLLEHDACPDDATLAATVAALREEGEHFAIRASHGVVRVPHDARTATAALRLADERMYEDKGSRRGSSRQQARDLLLQILREREPDLEDHGGDVGALATAVGRRLGLGQAALDELERAAELHDIGKVAVPEAILHKPGPLDAVEWRVMRQHTIVGERILMAAPALRTVAHLVRSSHERFDGGGYPDGLAGEDIPLGARIIAACDAFDAMRQKRSYAPSLTEAAAVAELRRCAGTQFDPDVVDALVGVLAEGAGAELRVA